MKTSFAGINLIKLFEGCKLTAYLCPAGKWTIGYGHTSAAGSPNVLPGMKIGQPGADTILISDLAKFEQYVTELVKVVLSQNQFDALVSFTYNLGPQALKTSTLLKRVNASRFNDVPAEFLKWVHSGKGEILDGLVRRRRAEADMWRGAAVSKPLNTDESRAQPSPRPASKTMAQSKEGNAAILTGGLAALSAANGTVSQVRDASDTAGTLIDMLQSRNFLVLVIIVLAAGAIWYWRKKRLDEEAQ